MLPFYLEAAIVVYQSFKNNCLANFTFSLQLETSWPADRWWVIDDELWPEGELFKVLQSGAKETNLPNRAQGRPVENYWGWLWQRIFPAKQSEDRQSNMLEEIRFLGICPSLNGWASPSRWKTVKVDNAGNLTLPHRGEERGWGRGRIWW